MVDVFDNEAVMADFTQLQSIFRKNQTRAKTNAAWVEQQTSRHKTLRHAQITKVQERFTFCLKLRSSFFLVI